MESFWINRFAKYNCSFYCFREAVFLAKLRLGEDDPIIKELFQSWALKHIRDLNFENAAKW